MNILRTRATVALSFVVILLTILSCSNDRIKIGIQPFENFSQGLIDTIAVSIEKTYDAEVVVFKKEKLPKKAFTNVKIPRYRADSLIDYLKKKKPDSIHYIIGVTDKDVSITKKYNGNIKLPRDKYLDWGVFGYAFQPGPSSVISSYRLAGQSQEIVAERVKKVSLHEIGHNLGLTHCNSSQCVMQDAAETIQTVDNVNPELCPACKKEIGLQSH